MMKPDFPPPPDDDELEKLAQVSEEALLPEKHDPSMPISGNVRCVFCGYNLFTIPRGGICPECGKPAAGSLHGDAYAYARPGYVRLLACGAVMIAWLPAGWFAICLLTLIQFGGRYTVTVYAALIWIVAMGLVFTVGIWLLTMSEQRDETAEGQTGGEFWRVVARGGGVLHGLAQIGWMLVPLLPGMTPSGSLGEGYPLLAWLCANALSLAAVGPWMARVARRTYQKGLPQAIFVACVAPACVLLVLLLWIVGDRFMRDSALARIMNAAGCLGACIWFSLAFMCLPLFVWAWYRLATSLSRAAMLARVHELYPDARVKL